MKFVPLVEFVSFSALHFYPGLLRSRQLSPGPVRSLNIDPWPLLMLNYHGFANSFRSAHHLVTASDINV